MKRVRVVAGAVGLAPLALALAPSAAHAATTAGLTKTVRSDVTTAARAECGVDATASGHGAGPIRGVIQYRGSCVGFRQVSIRGHVPGLTERVRFWKNGALLVTKWVNPGTFKSLSGIPETSFKSSPYEHVSMVCEALVANANHNDIRYGPVCERP